MQKPPPQKAGASQSMLTRSPALYSTTVNSSGARTVAPVGL
jgi:hypothetical protein